MTPVGWWHPSGWWLAWLARYTHRFCDCSLGDQ